MAGNVWEWTHSLFAEYPYRLDDGREDELKLGGRVVRGGSFYDNRELVRCAYRSRGGYLLDALGFRLAAAPLLKD